MNTLNKLTLTALLERSVSTFRDYPALTYVDSEPMSFGELGRNVTRVSRALSRLGVQPGDHIAILSQNMPTWPVVYFAVATMGAVVVPVLPDFSKTEVGNILEHANAKVVFASKRLASKLPERDSITVIRLDNLEGLPEIDDDPNEWEQPLTQPTEEDLAAIIYTSGTTGNSKGVMLTHKNLVSNVEASRPIAEIEPGESLISILPLAHAYECTIGMLVPLSAGAHINYLPVPPAPSVLMPALSKVRPHVMLSVPLIIEKIYRARVLPKLNSNAVLRAAMKLPPLRRLLHRAAGKKVMETFGGRLHFFGVGGAALAPDVERFLRDAKFPYAVGYGLTETSPLIAGCGPKHTVYRSTGPAVKGVKIRIADPDAKSGEGEIQAIGPNVMRGYYRDEARTAEMFTDDGWFRTGDLGIMDSRGNVSIKGRLKNMILGPSGENIYPEELEAVVNAQPMVADSLVMRRGAALVARVNLDFEAFRGYLETGEEEGTSHRVDFNVEALRTHAQRYLDELRATVNNELNAFSRISRFEVQMEPFEKTPTMKIKRYLYEAYLGTE